MLRDHIDKYYFDGNYNCAETVLHAGNEYYQLGLGEREMKLISAYGGGIQTGNTCGALLGAVSVLAMKYVEAKAHESKDIKAVVTMMMDRFQEKYASTLCSEVRPQCFAPQVRCLAAVQGACDILQGVIEEYDNRCLFRKAVEADRERILEIYDHIFTAEEQGPKVCGWMRGFYPTDEVCDEGIASGEMVVMEMGGKVVGSARFNSIQDDVFAKAKWRHEEADDKVLVLHTLTVDPLCSGRGLGRRFLAYYEQLARERGCTELRMDTGGTNSRARKIYADCGFVEADEIEYSFGEPEIEESKHTVIFLEKYIGE